MLLKCSRCGELLPPEAFTKKKGCKRGYAYACRRCSKERESELKTSNIRTYFADVLKTSKQMAQKRHIVVHSLNLDDLLTLYDKQGGRCAISGIAMTHIAGQGNVPTNASIDRVDSALGYTIDNVQLVCRFINQGKMQMSVEDFKRLMSEAYHFWQSQ